MAVGPRILAFAAAIAMVAGALVLRSKMDDDARARSAVLRLVCVTELQAVCDDLEADPDSNIKLTVEDAGVTAARLVGLASGEDPGLDGWLAIGDWPGIVDAERRSANKDLLFPSKRALASTRIGLVVWPDRAEALKACQQTWACLADAAAKGQWSAAGGKAEWGRVKIGLPDPERSAVGVNVLGALGTSSFGNTTFGRLEIDEDPDFQRRLGGLARASASIDPNLENMLAVGPAAVDAVPVLEAVVQQPDVQAIPRLQVTGVLYPAPVSMATAMLGTTSSGRAGAERDDAAVRLDQVVGALGRQRLLDSGWKPLVGTANNLPDPSVLAALRQAWSRVR